MIENNISLPNERPMSESAPVPTPDADSYISDIHKKVNVRILLEQLDFDTVVDDLSALLDTLSFLVKLESLASFGSFDLLNLLL